MGQKWMWKTSLPYSKHYILRSPPLTLKTVPEGGRVSLGTRKGEEVWNLEWNKKGCGVGLWSSDFSFLAPHLWSPLECWRPKDFIPGYLCFPLNACLQGNFLGLGGFSCHPYAGDTQLYNSSPGISLEHKTCVFSCQWTYPTRYLTSGHRVGKLQPVGQVGPDIWASTDKLRTVFTHSFVSRTLNL